MKRKSFNEEAPVDQDSEEVFLPSRKKQPTAIAIEKNIAPPENPASQTKHLPSRKKQPTDIAIEKNIAPPENPASQTKQRTLCFCQKYDSSTRRWGPKMVADTSCEDSLRFVRDKKIRVKTLTLPDHQGKIHLFPDWLSTLDEFERDDLLNQLYAYPHWRQYTVQGNPEPRTHCLFHEDATDKWEDPQPGYSYSRLNMKSRRLSRLPLLHTVSNQAKLLCNVPSWNIGVQPVLYRDGKDYIGFHADDDQGEELIFTVVVQASENGRTTMIVPKSRPQYRHGSMRFFLELQTGDSYAMDGKMQKHYLHSVIQCKSGLDDVSEHRMAIVCRYGRMEWLSNDSGIELENLLPRPSTASVPEKGNCIEGLTEGQVYTRNQLRDLRAHVSPQRSVSGSTHRGCEAIIVSNKREEGRDYFEQLVFFVEARIGGWALLVNYERNLPIRVFRSSHIANAFRASEYGKNKAGYRYDGIYRVNSVAIANQDYAMSQARSVSTNILFRYDLRRVRAGSDMTQNNRYTCKDFLCKFVSQNSVGLLSHREEIDSASCCPVSELETVPSLLRLANKDRKCSLSLLQVCQEFAKLKRIYVWLLNPPMHDVVVTVNMLQHLRKGPSEYENGCG